MVEKYDSYDLESLSELLDVAGRKTDSIGKTFLVNSFFSKDKGRKIPAKIPVFGSSTSLNEKGIIRNCIDLFTVANPIFYEGGVFNFDNKEYSHELEYLAGKELYNKSIELGLDPKQTMSNHMIDWSDAKLISSNNKETNEIESVETSGKIKDKKNIYNLLEKHLNKINENYFKVMKNSQVPFHIKESYKRMTDF